jgi:hypothetical protein
MNPQWLANLKKEFNERPVQVIIVATAAAYSAAKLIDAVAGIRSRGAYAKQIKLRERGL